MARIMNRREINSQIWNFSKGGKTNAKLTADEIYRLTGRLWDLIVTDRREPSRAGKYLAALIEAVTLLKANTLPLDVGNLRQHIVEFIIWTFNRTQSRSSLDPAITPVSIQGLIAVADIPVSNLRARGVSSYYCQGPTLSASRAADMILDRFRNMCNHLSVHRASKNELGQMVEDSISLYFYFISRNDLEAALEISILCITFCGRLKDALETVMLSRAIEEELKILWSIFFRHARLFSYRPRVYLARGLLTTSLES